MPEDAALAAARERVGYQHVVLDASGRTIHFDRSGVELDLGGIAKGYAVDRAVDVLRRGGVTAALVSAGGSTIYGMGAPPDRTAWQVGVEDPLNSREMALEVALKDEAVSVAGRSEKSFEHEGITYSHIMDPRTGRPVQGMLTVAVTAATGTLGDALDDAFFVQGLEKSRAHIARSPGVQAWFFVPAPRHTWKLLHLTR